ncbi:AsmA-like C-terminal region-containing protein [Lutibacter sp.]|uniref:AsmA-like C-terminal region-containing protein n=1 Tax=Lutibacter sp. TaxID=1925666 RepID=UPI0035679902
MLKKIIKGLGIFIIVSIIALAIVPFVFKDKIKALVLKTMNEKVDAVVAFNEVDLSLFKNFPKATVSIDDLSIVNKVPFENDTLFYADNFILKMSIKELFKAEGEPMGIDAFSIENAKVSVIFNKDGLANYDIALKDKNERDSIKNNDFSLNFQQYNIKNLRFTYFDEASKMSVILDSINHEGSGDFKNKILDLDTKSNAKLAVSIDKTNYLKNVTLSLDAVLGLDLENFKYTFKENEALVNLLPIAFDGFIQMTDAGQLYDLKFKTPTSSFKNFLGLIPEMYSGKLDGVKTSGDFKVNGIVKGIYTEKNIPAFDIEIASDNASFQYPNLPKSVKNIVIDSRIVNKTGIFNDTYVNFDKLLFTIDQDVFNAKATIQNIVENPLINAELKGIVNLANVSKAYPIKLEKPLTGILKADVVTRFDMKSVEASQYQNIQNSGTITVTDFNYESKEMAKPFKIKQAAIAFNPTQIRLNKFDGETGNSDFHVTGSLDNFYGFLFKDQVLKGNFEMTSQQFEVADFMETKSDTTSTKTSKEALKIPAFLDVTIAAKATTVVYDNLNLKEVSGNLAIKDEAVSLSNLKMNAFGGQIALSGMVSTKEKTPKFKMDLDLNALNISESFTQLAMLKAIAPIANAVIGKLNSTIKLSGNLTNNMTPDLKTISGNLIGQLLDSKLSPSNSQLLTALSSNVKFINLEKLNLDALKMALTFKDGKVEINPFTLKYQDINIEVAGSHGFDQSMAYNLKFDVPAKYLGTEVNNLISKLTPANAAKIENFPINAILSGSFANPKVSTDMKQATTNLVTQLVEMQKGKLIDQATEALGNLIPGKTKVDTTQTKSVDTIKEVTPIKESLNNVNDSIVKNALKNLFKKKQ